MNRAKSADHIMPKFNNVGRKPRTTSMVEKSSPKHSISQPRHKTSLGNFDHMRHRRERTTKCPKSPAIQEEVVSRPVSSRTGSNSNRCESKHDLKQLSVDELILMNRKTEKRLFDKYKESSFYNLHILLRYQTVQMSGSYAEPFIVGRDMDLDHINAHHFGMSQD